MATITTRSGKGSPLTNTEVDANFTNLNSDKLEEGDISVSTASASGSGSLSYASTVFTFTPPDLTSYITDLSSFDTDNLSEGATNLYYTEERVDDRVNALIQAGSGIALTYDDASNELTIDSDHIEYDATNNSGASIPVGTPVYQTGSSGNTITIAPADANGSGTMPAIGMTSETIANAGTGKVTFLGIVSGFDTSAFSEGDTLYISETAGSLTATKPVASGTSVQNFAKVIKSHASNGSVVVMGAGRSNDVPNLADSYVFIGNGTDAYEMRQLTTDDATEGTNLFFTTARIDSHLSGGTGVTYSAGTISIGQAVSTTSDVTFNDVTVSGDLTVSGTTTTVNTETINLADNLITLNSNESGTPSENAGLEIERGTSTNVQLRWNETDDKWQSTDDGSNYYDLINENDIGSTVQAHDSNLTSFVSTFTLPTSDGTSGQTIQTDGAGNLTLVDPAQGGYDSKTIDEDTTLDADTHYRAGNSTVINSDITLTVPVDTLLEVYHEYIAEKAL